MSVERAKEQLKLSEGRWESAIREHAQPPPDAGFVRRLRSLADAAAQEQAAYGYAADRGSGGGPVRHGYHRTSSVLPPGASRSRRSRPGSDSTTPSPGFHAHGLG
jgi:hypothetical protein